MRKTIYRTNDPKIVGIFFILFSIVFIIVGILVLMMPKIKAQKCTESVRAEVMENLPVEISHKSRSRRRRTSVMYKPVFCFTYNGQEYRVESKTSSDPPAFQSGEIVELKINPDDPTDFYAPSDKSIGFVGIIFSGMGALLLIIGVSLKVGFGKNEKGENP